MKLTEYRVGEIMRLARRPVDVRAEDLYDEIGLRSFGNGIFHKPPVSGEELGAKKVFHIKPGDLLFSNVFAWEGAVALASDQEAGKIGSHRFMTYEVDPQKANSRYLLHYFYGGPGLRAIREASPGSAGRNRTLGIKNFERQSVWLPDLDEQHRIVNKLEVALNQRSAALSAAIARADLVFAAFDAMKEEILDHGVASGWDCKALGEVSDVNPRTKRPEGGEKVAFVPMSAVNGTTGEIEKPEYAAASDIGSGYKMFRRGDVIFARITPCMQNGKSAIFQDSATEYGFGSTEFHVIRPHVAVDARWIHRVVRTRRFREMAAPHMTGTAGQQRISAGYLQGVKIPVPSIEQQYSAIKKIDDLQKLRLEFRAMHRAQIDSLKALRAALLQAAFSGQI
jgi:type I restriction enzyme S subunit